MLKNKNNFEIINSFFFIVRPRNFETYLVGTALFMLKIVDID